MKVYISGKVTGEFRDKCRYKFGYYATRLREQGHSVINPFAMFNDMRGDFDKEDEMTICFAAITVCDAVYMLEDWHDSEGAKMEHKFALDHGKKIIYQTAEGLKNASKDDKM